MSSNALTARVPLMGQSQGEDRAAYAFSSAWDIAEELASSVNKVKTHPGPRMRMCLIRGDDQQGCVSEPVSVSTKVVADKGIV